MGGICMTRAENELSDHATNDVAGKWSSEVIEWLGLNDKSPLTTPEMRLIQLSQEFPFIWKDLEELWNWHRKAKTKWPEYCLLPSTVFTSLAIKSTWHQDDYDKPLDTLTINLTGAMEALGTWRYSKGVYRFDDSVYEAIIDAPTVGALPSEVICRLPEWSVYIETPALFGGRCHGFWATLSWRENHGTTLSIVLNLSSWVCPLHVEIGPWTIEQGINRIRQKMEDGVSSGAYTDNFTNDNFSTVCLQVATVCIPLLLYLCQDQPDITDDKQPGSIPSRPQPRRVKGGYRMFPADRVRVWSVGKETGEMIRKAWQGGEHGKVRPHLRRAHWHGYWTGPLAGERKFSYKWLPPIPVGG